MVCLDSLAHKVLLVRREKLDRPVSLARRAKLDHLDNKDYLVRQDRPDRTAVMEHKEKTATLEPKVTEE